MSDLKVREGLTLKLKLSEIDSELTRQKLLTFNGVHLSATRVSIPLKA